MSCLKPVLKECQNCSNSNRYISGLTGIFARGFLQYGPWNKAFKAVMKKQKCHLNFKPIFFPNESSISQASYLTMDLTICFQLFKKQTILWSRVVEKQWNAWWCSSIRHTIWISFSVKDELISEIFSEFVTFLSDKMFWKFSSLI